MDLVHHLKCNIELRLSGNEFSNDADMERSAKSIIDIVEQIARETCGEYGFGMAASVTRDYQIKPDTTPRLSVQMVSPRRSPSEE